MILGQSAMLSSRISLFLTVRDGNAMERLIVRQRRDD
jgi:hypothetical protein